MKVARVKRRIYAAQELPPSVWRSQLKTIGRWVLIGYAVLFYVFVAASLAS